MGGLESAFPEQGPFTAFLARVTLALLPDAKARSLPSCFVAVFLHRGLIWAGFRIRPAAALTAAGLLFEP